jgi:hypothetical protein
MYQYLLPCTNTMFLYMFYISQMIFGKKMQISLGEGKCSDSTGAPQDLNTALQVFKKNYTKVHKSRF